jgi:putative FmdB family regulatory protein
MPRYVYHCEKCDDVFEYYHSMKEKITECEVCKQQTLLKVPHFSGIVKKELKQKPGSIVDNYIEDAREEIRREKEQLRKTEYKPE